MLEILLTKITQQQLLAERSLPIIQYTYIDVYRVVFSIIGIVTVFPFNDSHVLFSCHLIVYH